MSQSTARKRALNTLYEADIKREPIERVLEERLNYAGAPTPLPSYGCEIIRGVAQHKTEIDALLMQHSIDWDLERMSVIDRNILRIAVWEMLYNPSVPRDVAIHEALDLARRYSDESSVPFLQGVLSAIKDRKADSSLPELNHQDGESGDSDSLQRHAI